MKLHSRNRKRNLNVFEQGQDTQTHNMWEEQSKRMKTDGGIGIDINAPSGPNGMDGGVFDKDGMM